MDLSDFDSTAAPSPVNLPATTNPTPVATPPPPSDASPERLSPTARASWRRERYVPSEGALLSTRRHLDRVAAAKQASTWGSAGTRPDGVRVLPSNLTPVRSSAAFPEEPPAVSTVYDGLIIDNSYWTGLLDLLKRAPLPTVARLTANNVEAANEQLARAREMFDRYQIAGTIQNSALAVILASFGVPTSDAQASALIQRAMEGRRQGLDEANYVRLMQVVQTQLSRTLVAQQLLQRSTESDAAAAQAILEGHAVANSSSLLLTPRRAGTGRSPSRSHSPSSSRLPCTTLTASVSGSVIMGCSSSHAGAHHTLKSLQIAAASPTTPSQIRERSPSPTASRRSPSVGTTTRSIGVCATPRSGSKQPSVAGASATRARRSVTPTTSSSSSPSAAKLSGASPRHAAVLSDAERAKREKLLTFIASPSLRPHRTSEPTLEGHSLLSKVPVAGGGRSLERRLYCSEDIERRAPADTGPS